MQADLNVEDKNGFFIGTFLSNAEFSDEALGDNAQVTTEIDYLAGKHWVGDVWELQLTYNRYTFPSAEIFDADDFSFTGNYKAFLFELSYMDDYFGYKSIYKYFRVGYGWSYGNKIESSFQVGYNALSTPKGSLKTRCLNTGCSETAQTLNGAGSPDYFDLYLSNRKVLENGIILELAFNWTNRKEYLVDEGEVTLERAKDFATVISLVMPLTL